jgi:hypothetical protein
MVENDFVENASVNLKGSLSTLSLELCRTRRVPELLIYQEIDIPKLVRFPPTIGAPDFNRKSSRFNLIPGAHLIKNETCYEQLALANVIPGKVFALDNKDAQRRIVLSQLSGHGATSRVATDDKNVALNCHLR